MMNVNQLLDEVLWVSDEVHILYTSKVCDQKAYALMLKLKADILDRGYTCKQAAKIYTSMTNKEELLADVEETLRKL